jgi:hypothetical protein
MQRLENTVADLVGRIAAIEDRENKEDTTGLRNTRSKAQTDPQMTKKLEELGKAQ